MRAKEEAFRLLEEALSVASTGSDEVEVSLLGGKLGLTEFSRNQVHPSTELDVELVSMRILQDGRSVSACSSDMSKAGVKELAATLRARLPRLPTDVGVDELPKAQSYADVDAYDSETDALSALDREALAGQAVREALKSDLVGAGYSAVRRGVVDIDGTPGVYAVANTRGVLAYHPETRVTFGVSMSTKEGARGWAEDESFTMAALEPPEIVRAAKQRALLGGRPGHVPPGTYSAILEPAVVAELLRHLGETCGAQMMQEGLSFLSERQGQTVVTGTAISLRDDFSHALHRGAPFDVDGVARQSVQIIDAGVAGSPVVSWASARRLELEATGHGVPATGLQPGEAARHLVLEGGEATYADLLGATRNGVLISRLSRTQLVDARTLTVSGATRDGLFIIENGEPVAQLHDMSFTLSVLDLLGAIEEMTASTWAAGAVVPAVKATFPLSLGAP